MPSSSAAPTRQLARAWTRCRHDRLCPKSTRRPLPSSERAIAPTQRRRRSPVLDRASSASPRADKRAHIWSAYSQNSLKRGSPCPTAVSGPLDAMRHACVDRTLEVNLHAASKAPAGVVFAKVMPDKPPGQDSKPKDRMLIDARQQQRPPHPHATTPAPSQMTRPSLPPRNDGVARPTDSSSSTSYFMGHRVRPRWQEWS
jgi:hypothetical protein